MASVSVLASLFKTLIPVLWTSAKSTGKETLKVLEREASRTAGKILTDIAENPQAETQDISKHVTDSTQNIIKTLRGGGRKRKRASSSPRNPKRKRAKTKRALLGSAISRDIFS